MHDLISRQAAIDAIDTGNLHRGIVGAVQNIISELPSAEPEIVRCKDCKFSEHWYRDRRRCFLWLDDGNALSVFNDGFCNYGERKQDG